ncbi:hypothetical protein GOODEAATRI_033249 [Goodea atripinnis]|uniref:Receptor ligand binding region domain-containing protein n=1 Tax=Goodea atripinnis TaxID=208336 RepID=A0ABV0MMP9_9TELE
MFDHCSDMRSFPGIFKLISVNGQIQPWAEPTTRLSKVIAVVGPSTSTQALTVAPFFMVDLIPMIELQRIHVIIVFAAELAAEALIESAVGFNITNKSVVRVPGFGDFIRSAEGQCGYNGQQMFCNQISNCSDWSANDILEADPSFSFPVYSAVYAIAHALHKTLQCGEGGCNNITAYPKMVLAELQKSNFTLLNRTIQFDKNGDLKFGLYFFVFWNHAGDAQRIGFYQFNPTVHFYINSTEILWYTNGEVRTLLFE